MKSNNLQSIFSTQQPEELFKLDIDYNTLESFSVIIQKATENQWMRKTIGRGTACVCKSYLIFNEKQGFKPPVMMWLDIWLYRMKLNHKSLFSTEQLEIQLESENKQTDFIIKFQNDDQLKKFQLFLQKVCIYTSPTLKMLYEHQKTLGRGGQAIVGLYKQKGSEGNEKLLAIKTYKIHHFEMFKQVYREIKCLRELEICRNIVQLEQVFIENNLVHLVMNYAKHGSLFNHLASIDSFSEADLRMIMEQLLLAIDLMHKREIVHRDLKPDNILVMDREKLDVCLADLGLACKLDESDLLGKKCGTAGYLAPEILRGLNASPKSDIFSLGSIFYNLMTGSMLFEGKHEKQVLINNQYKDPSDIIDEDLLTMSEDAVSLMRWMLQRQADQRPTAEECLNHKWFSQDQEALQNLIQFNKITQNIKQGPQLGDVADQEIEFTSFIKAPNYYGNNDCSDMSLNMLSFFSQTSGNGTPDERKRANSEKLKMMSNVKISYNEMIQKGRDQSANSNNGSSARNNNNNQNAGNVYDFRGATQYVLKKASLHIQNGDVQNRNFNGKYSDISVVQQQQRLEIEAGSLIKKNYSNINVNNADQSNMMNNQFAPLELRRPEFQLQQSPQQVGVGCNSLTSFDENDFTEHPMKPNQTEDEQMIEQKFKNRNHIDDVIQFKKSFTIMNRKNRFQ